jgi:hypothetical protein
VEFLLVENCNLGNRRREERIPLFESTASDWKEPHAAMLGRNLRADPKVRSFKLVTRCFTELDRKRRNIVVRAMPVEANIVDQEKRRVPRYVFFATAELLEEKSDVRIPSRVSELSLYGCYLDMMNPFPAGTLIMVKITAGEEFFQAKSRIVYSQMNVGAGVNFLEVDASSQAVLEHWLEEADKHNQKI